LANNETSQVKRQDEQTEGSCRIAINFHSAPHALGMRNREPRTPASKALPPGNPHSRACQMALLEGGTGLVPVDNVDELPGVFA
jgi:hypothetical protein